MDPERPDPTTSPWRTLASREVYANPWITVREHEVVTPTGTSGIYGVVSKPLALGAVVLDEHDRVVLVGQWRYPLGRYSWELPEGAHDADHDATPLDGMRRELAEEAGLAAADWTLLTARPVALSNSVTDEEALLWLARDLTPTGATSHDPTEDLRVTRVPFERALTAALDGRIDDAMSLLGLLLAERVLG